MSHHLSGPNLRSPEDDARLDLTDLFVFPAATTGRTVLIMDVNPYAPKRAAALHPGAVYRINVDTDGDNRADIAFSFTCSEYRDGQQTCSVYRAIGERARDYEAGGERLLADAPVCFGAEATVTHTGPYTFFCGLRSDPFFADLDGIVHDFQWTGVDAMAEENIFGLCLEMPDSLLGDNPAIGVWARVCVRRDGRLVSVDRGAHPSLTAYFNAEDVKEEYNTREPADDWDHYRAPWTAALQHFGGYSQDAAEKALRTVLPDILRYDRTRPAHYPNGRSLTDDVTSARLAMLTNGKISSDNIPPHGDLLREFPYLGAPHPAHAMAG